MTISEYLTHKYALANTTYIRKQGKGFYLVNNELIPEKQFKAMHVIPTVLNGCKENPDNRNKYLL